MNIENDLLKNLINEYIRQQQTAQTKRRIRNRKSDILGTLEKRLLSREISEAEYKQKKARYVDSLYELYAKDIITFEELRRKINQ